MCTSPTHAPLPPEIWIRVYHWATYGSARDLRGLLEVPPFGGITHYEDETGGKEALKVKATLALVCKQWRVLSQQFLYEDLRVGHGKRILADVLEESRKQCPQGIGNGRYVNRILLPDVRTKSAGYGNGRHWADEETSRIIKCCPKLLVLSRYRAIYSTGEDDGVEYDEYLDRESLSGLSEPDCCFIHDPPLPFLRRLDWFNGTMLAQQSLLDQTWSPTICAIPSALWSAQQLEVLSLSGDNYFWGPKDLQSLSGRAILLPKVHTLRVGSIYAFGVPGISGYTLALPSLRRIILDRGEALHGLIECVVASPGSSTSPDVTALEVGSPHWRFMRSDYISTLIRHYPTAESLHYPVFFARPLRWHRLRSNGLAYVPHEMHKLFSNLKHVGLHAEPNPEIFYHLDSSSRKNDKNSNWIADAVWPHLYSHARALLGSTSPVLSESRLPGVRSIALHGHSWLPLVNDSRFHIILDLVRTRGSELVAVHPRVADALREALFDYRTDLILEWICKL